MAVAKKNKEVKKIMKAGNKSEDSSILSINNKINMNTNHEINKYKNNFQENNENININDMNILLFK